MPLLTSPIDGAPMRQVRRHGVEFDVCPTSGGVWLDKGELEKLVAVVKEETSRRLYRDDDEVDDAFDEGETRNRHGGGRRSRLSDLFEF